MKLLMFLINLQMITPVYAQVEESTEGVSGVVEVCSNGDFVTIQKLISFFGTVAVNFQNEAGETCLMAAAAEGHEELVDLLLQSGADKTLEDKSGATAYRYAIWTGHYDIARKINPNK